ncbi:glycerophosphodiester phosphodiesterase [Tunicatimonas pelagia]|uniref:glycerophosphodiester phosphodiesterase n=1 Tax=Tunicatimonas pelagia TaxID=931531 RepID=UPI002665CEE9|nr:glycerophosphodiester phosphodiesterase [Tunicatimonas pelagia]WKN41997.1 glycerophosphodiester phosphodiesterase [Tunicatimonas pelagia]
MKVRLFFLVVLFSTVLFITQTKGQGSNLPLDIQGHRGCRGLLPENTIPAFIEAVKLGVTTLELDVVISQDRQVVVSHEPFLSHIICHTAEGQPIAEEEEKEHNLYQMPYQEIARCDCGSSPHPKFPEQENFPAHKPLLSDVIDTVEQLIAAQNLAPVLYNIETKSNPKGDNIFHPAPDKFTDLLLSVIQEKGIESRVVIQSFDVRTLQQVRKKQPSLPLALLVENTNSLEENLATLGFTPKIYSPNFRVVDQSLLDLAQQKGMKVIPWTVNDPKDIQQMIDLQVDGIISDYPDRVIKITGQ